MNVITPLLSHLPSRRRTKQGGSVRRQFSPEQRPLFQERLRRRLLRLPGTIVFPRRSGKRSLVSSIQAKEDARFSTAPWGAVSLMDAAMLMFAWSVVQRMRGMAIIELHRSHHLDSGSVQVEFNLVSRSARMTLWSIISWQCLFRLLFGNRGRMFRKMFILWLGWGPGVWKSSQGLLVWLVLFRQWVCHVSHRSMSQYVRWFQNLLMCWMLIDGHFSCSSFSWEQFASPILALRAIHSQRLAKMMEAHLLYVQWSGRMVYHPSRVSSGTQLS